MRYMLMMMKEAVEKYLDQLGDKEFNLVISRFCRKQYLSESALSQGYGIEDVLTFVRWLSNEFEIDL